MQSGFLMPQLRQRTNHKFCDAIDNQIRSTAGDVFDRADRGTEQPYDQTIFKRCKQKLWPSSGIETQWWHEWDANVLQVRLLLGRNISHFI